MNNPSLLLYLPSRASSFLRKYGREDRPLFRSCIRSLRICLALIVALQMPYASLFASSGTEPLPQEDADELRLVFRIRVRPNVAVTDQGRIVAINDLLKGFNGLALHAGDLRSAMRIEDAQAFDAAMMDIMSALISLPGIGVGRSGDAARIIPRRARYDRVSQIKPDLLALERLFGRQPQASRSVAEGRMFDRAGKNAHKILSALPFVLPTVDAGIRRTGNTAESVR